MPSLIEKLIERLQYCPCCNASTLSTSKTEDGIPEDCLHESVFNCGARVFVTMDEDFRIGAGCPNGLYGALGEIYMEISDEEAEEP